MSVIYSFERKRNFVNVTKIIQKENVSTTDDPWFLSIELTNDIEKGKKMLCYYVSEKK